MEVVIEDIIVMYVTSPNDPKDDPKGAEEAFKKLEDAIKWQLKGRKFYGTMFNGEYRANLAIVEGEDPEKLGFPTWTIHGGKYYREKINDWEKHIAEIAQKCDEIIQKVRYDDSRPIVEFYRSLKELLLFIPIK